MLGTLAGHRSSLTLSELAREVDLPKTTVLRLLTALEDLGMAERVEGRYLLGHGVTTLTRNAAPVSSLRSVARPYLAELSDTYGENASVGIDDGAELLYIDTTLAPGAVQVSDWTGWRVPFHTDAAGLVMMSTWAIEQIAEYASRDLATPTKRTSSTAADLTARTQTIRTAGFAWTYGEFSEEVNGIAAPVWSDGEVIGAVNVYGPAYRWPGEHETEKVASHLIEVCERISHRFTSP